MKKNIEFVAVDPQLECSWKLLVESKARTISQSVDEILSITENVLDSFDGVVRPTRIEYAIGTLAEELPIAVVFDRAKRPDLNIERKPIENKSDVRFEALEDSVRKSGSDHSQLLTLVSVTQSATGIRLETGDYFVSRSSAKAKTWRNGVVNSTPVNDPLVVEIRLQRPKEDDGRPHYAITLATSTDIWFEETEYGRVNRERLATFLRDLYERLDVADLQVASNRYEDETLRSLVFEQA